MNLTPAMVIFLRAYVPRPIKIRNVRGKDGRTLIALQRRNMIRNLHINKTDPIHKWRFNFTAKGQNTINDLSRLSSTSSVYRALIGAL